MQNKTTVYLIRHGAADVPTDVAGRPLIYGSDAPLSHEGRIQMRKLGAELQMQGIRMAGMYSSISPRALSSAEILVKMLGTRVLLISPGFRPTRIPSWEGKPASELGPIENLFRDEPMGDVERRVMRSFGRVIDQQEGKTAGIVSHAEEIGILMHRLLNPQAEGPGLIEELPNGQALRLRIDFQHRLIEHETVIPLGISPRGVELR